MWAGEITSIIRRSWEIVLPESLPVAWRFLDDYPVHLDGYAVSFRILP